MPEAPQQFGLVRELSELAWCHGHREVARGLVVALDLMALHVLSQLGEVIDAELFELCHLGGKPRQAVAHAMGERCLQEARVATARPVSGSCAGRSGSDCSQNELGSASA